MGVCLLVLASGAGVAAATDAPPAAPRSPAALLVDGVVHLSWQDASTDEWTFDIHRSDYDAVTRRWQPFGLVAVVAENSTAATDTPPRVGIYRYRILAYGPGGLSTGPHPTVLVPVGVAPPAAPGDVTAVPDGGHVIVSWTDLATDEDFYQITTSSRPWGASTWTVDHAYMPANAVAAPMPSTDPSTTQVFYSVRARNTAGHSTAVRAGVAAPGQRSLVSASGTGCPAACTVTLAWSTPGAPVVVRYRSRATPADPWGPLVEVPAAHVGPEAQIAVPGPGTYQFSWASLAFDGVTRSVFSATTVVMRAG